MALASSGKADDEAWNRRLLGLDGALDAETTSEDADRSKPHPDIFEAALAATGARPEEAIAIGDSPWDAEAARRAGVRTIGLLSGGFAEPDLRAGWDRYEHRGEASSMWEDIKEAVRDAWDRVVGTRDTTITDPAEARSRPRE